MSVTTGKLLIHARNIAHETLDGETIVIHLETGSYYSLTGSGAEIWNLLGAGASAAQISAALAERQQRPERDIRVEVESFIADLEREQLIEDSDAAMSGPLATTIEADGVWAPPKLERYDDMRDFLLVDPIHEVDATGWPNRKVAQ